MEKPITFMSESLPLEGRLEKGLSNMGVVITHPHPLYGGDMHNPVVVVLRQAYQKSGYTTLRFNFRGVGDSQGAYGDGIGEQKDVQAALVYLATMGATHLALAGYSFGAWVNARLNWRANAVEAMVMVSPPVAVVEFESIDGIDCLKLIVTGSRDDIAPPHLINRLQPKWNPAARTEIISGADHFYLGYYDCLLRILVAYI